MSSWVRLWHDMPTDPKWRVIARRSGRSVSEVIAIFNFVMVNASANATERGRTHNLFADDIAAALDLEEPEVQAVLDAMQGKVMDGNRLSGWETRQPKREDESASRAKAWREAQKAERDRTQENATERPDAETETDKREGYAGAKQTLIDPDFKPVLTPEAQRKVDAWPEGLFEDQVFAFVAHAQANARTQTDWQAAFRSWISKTDVKRKTPNGTDNRTGSSRRYDVRKSGLAAACDDIIENGGSIAGAGQR